MADIELQFEVGIRQAMDMLGHASTYTRKDNGESVSLLVHFLDPQYRTSDDGSVLITASDRWEALVLTSDLSFNYTYYEPRSGDTIVCDGTTYVVSIDEVRRYCWSWADHHKLRRHIFLKRISV